MVGGRSQVVGCVAGLAPPAGLSHPRPNGHDAAYCKGLNWAPQPYILLPRASRGTNVCDGYGQRVLICPCAVRSGSNVYKLIVAIRSAGAVWAKNRGQTRATPAAGGVPKTQSKHANKIPEARLRCTENIRNDSSQRKEQIKDTGITQKTVEWYFRESQVDRPNHDPIAQNGSRDR